MYSRISNALTASCQAPSSATNKTIAAAFRVSQRTMSVERQRHRVPSASTRPAFWEVEEEHAHRGTKIRWLVTVVVTTTGGLPGRHRRVLGVRQSRGPRHAECQLRGAAPISPRAADRR